MTTPAGPGQSGYDIGAVVPVPLSKLATTTGGSLATGVGWLSNLSIVNEAATAACKVYVRDGADNSGPVVAVLAAVAGQGSSVSPSWRGILIRQGVYVQVAAGTVSIAASWAPLIQPPE